MAELLHWIAFDCTGVPTSGLLNVFENKKSFQTVFFKE